MKITKSIHKSMFLFFGIVVASNCFSQEFIHHIANPNNTLGDYTEINHIKTNSHPDAILVITRVANLKKSKEPPQFGVEYKDGKWRIFSKNRMSVPLNSAFIIAVKNVPNDNCFTLAECLTGDAKEIPIRSLPIAGETPAKIFFTEKRDEFTARHGFIANSICRNGRWQIQFQDEAPKGDVVKFNVLVLRREKTKTSSSQATHISF